MSSVYGALLYYSLCGAISITVYLSQCALTQPTSYDIPILLLMLKSVRI